MTSTILSTCMLLGLVCTVRQQFTPPLWRGASPSLEGPEAAEAMLREAWQDPSGADEIAEVTPAGEGRRGVALSEVESLTTTRLWMLIAEAGFSRHPDHAAMLHAIDRLAARSGRTVAETINRHVSEFDRGWSPKRRWILGISTACTEPVGFPAHLNWVGVHRYHCIRLVRMIRLHARGKLSDPCRGRPDQWRSRRAKKAIRKARRKGWRQIGCGRDSLHVFFNSQRRS